MEVAGRWRQQWAGAAQYGKMMDGVGGVVRTARAMEVLQTSGPGAQVRVTRSAYHSTGPLSTSYLLHSSTRTILSSRGDVLKSPSLVSKPLELSSTPLDAAASDSCPEGDEPYKVTEPDDTYISEPSKWRSSLGRRSMRMPSEESSSTDNASLVDSNGRTYFPISSRRTDSSKTSTSSQSLTGVESKSLRSSFRRNPTSEPLMKISEHAKCLEESSVSKFNSGKPRDEWHDRRNSYGFEHSPPNGIKSLTAEDKIGMESSTDSGICKSTEVVNIPITKYDSYDVGEHKDVGRKIDDQHESFQDWLAKNRSTSTINSDFTTSIGRKNRDASHINLRSPGKISITLPSSSDRDSDDNAENRQNMHRKNCDNSDRKLKKVEFCKTELHFAAESGKVKIIETDEKPPSTNDFRRRRSAFVPIRDQYERPITLFGGTYINESNTMKQTYFGKNENGDIDDRLNNDNDNDSIVKSILKNKIPKPKPYLLGEDIEFDKDHTPENTIWGVRLRKTSDDYLDSETTKSPISTLNESLKQENKQVQKQAQDTGHQFRKIRERSSDRDYSKRPLRDWKSDPADYVNLSSLHTQNQPLKSVASTQTSDDFIYDTVNKTYNISVTDKTKKIGSTKKADIDNSTHFVHEKLKLLQMSPILQNRARTRHLRQNELSYFGIAPDDTTSKTKSTISTQKTTSETSIEPVRRRNKNTNNVYQPPLYQNLPINTSLAPVPAPRSTKKLEQDVFNIPILRYSSDNDSSSNNQSDDEREIITGGKISTRVLETINELKVSSQGTIKNNSGSVNKCSKSESKHKSIKSSPKVVRVESCSRRAISKSNSKESLAHSRESSLEDTERQKLIKPHSSRERTREAIKSSKPVSESTPLIRKTDKLKTEKTKCNKLDKKHEDCSTVSSKATDSLTQKIRSQRNSGDAKDSFDRNSSTHLRNETEKFDRSPSKEKHSKRPDESNLQENISDRNQFNKKHLTAKNGHRVRSSSKEKHSKLSNESNVEEEMHIQRTCKKKSNPRKENEHGTASSSKEKHFFTEKFTEASNEDNTNIRRSSDNNRSHSRKGEYRTRSSSKEKHSKFVDGSNIERKTSQTKSYEQRPKTESRNKEYIMNYDDKNGTLSSVSRGSGRHSSNRNHDRTLKKIEEKPKETMRTSRVKLELKSPMMSTKELHRRTKSADHRSPKRKHKEEPPQ